MFERKLVRSWRVVMFVGVLAFVAASLPATCQAEEKTKKRTADSGPDWPKASLAEHKIRASLDDPTTLEFIETPLKDVVDYLKDLHAIEIQIDGKALDGVGVSTDTPVTRNLKGVTLRSALTLMLKDLDLTFMIKDDVLQITTPEIVDNHVTLQTYSVRDIVANEAAGSALTAAVEMAFDPPPQQPVPEGMKPPPQAPRLVMLRGLLVVRGNPREHERIADLLSQVRGQLKEARPASPSGP